MMDKNYKSRAKIEEIEEILKSNFVTPTLFSSESNIIDKNHPEKAIWQKMSDDNWLYASYKSGCIALEEEDIELAKAYFIKANYIKRSN